MTKRAVSTGFLGLSMAFALALALGGCGGGGGGDSSASTDGRIILNVTDAPVDDLYEVWVTFDKVVIQPSDDGLARLEYEIDPPMAIELKALGEGVAAQLIDEPIPAGDYSWIRLEVLEYPDTFVYETEDDAVADLRTLLDCPSCSPDQSGLKLNHPFTIEAEGIAEFTIDFDLSKSITDPVGLDGYKLRPTLRIVDVDVASTYFAGTVTDEQTEDPPAIDVLASCAVYVYEGADVVPDDNCIADPDVDATACDAHSGVQPYTSADLETTETEGVYTYQTGYMYEAAYTVTLACGEDAADADDDLTFIGTTTVDPADAGANTVDFIVTD